MGFEKAKFEIIQKSAKKFLKINSETKDDIISDIEKYNFKKILDEIVKSILEGKFELKDIHSIILVLSQLHRIYEGFTEKFLSNLSKIMESCYVELSNPSKNEDEEEKKLNKTKIYSSLFLECYLYGLNNNFESIKPFFHKFVNKKNTKEIFFQYFPILVFIMSEYALPLFNIKNRKLINLINEKKIKDFSLPTEHNKDINEKLYNGFKDFYNKKILKYLEEEHDKLDELEKKNFESVKNFDIENDTTILYTKTRNNYLKYINLINKFAETMNFDIPELANEKTLRYEQQKKTEMKFEKINKYDPFSNEDEYNFYNFFISTNLYTPIQTKSDDKYDYYRKLDDLIEKTLKCDSKETIDDIANDYLSCGIFNQLKNRKYLVNELIKKSEINFKYIGRLFRNISPVFKDFPKNLVDIVMENYENNLVQLTDDNDNINDKFFLNNCKLISELVKFQLFPMKNIFEIIQKLLEINKYGILSEILINCGRYLYLNELSSQKFGAFLDKLKKYVHNNLSHDERSHNKINNAINICKPQEKSLKKKVKIRTIEEEYIRFLINQILNEETIKKISVLLRKMDWNKCENIILKVIFKYLMNNNEEKIKICIELISNLKDYHPKFIFNLINILLEQIRIGLERNDFNDNQHKILLSNLLGYFYIYKIINTDLLYYTLYMIINFNPEWSYGRKDLIINNPLDSPVNTFRILMIITTLDICGYKLTNKNKKEKLDEFIQYLQIYILTKQYLPLEIENRITFCFENLKCGYEIYNDFNNALKASRKYQGLNFNFEEEEDIKEKKEIKKINIVEKEKKEEENEFKRKEENKEFKPIDIDSEIQKIISESLAKSKGTTMVNTVINPFSDIKKKDLIKSNPTEGKFRLFTKKDNKIIMKEVEKNIDSKKDIDEIDKFNSDDDN